MVRLAHALEPPAPDPRNVSDQSDLLAGQDELLALLDVRLGVDGDLDRLLIDELRHELAGLSASPRLLLQDTLCQEIGQKHAVAIAQQ